MKIKAPTNWDDGLLPEFARLGVAEVYGRAAEDLVGGGRAASLATGAGKRRPARHIEQVRTLGMEFDYLFNATCLNNVEVSRGGYKAIERTIGEAVSWGASGVTVSSPFLLRLVKEKFPGLTVSLSVFARVDTPQMLVFWERLGADRVTVFEHKVNRDFEALRALRKATKLPLYVIANNACLQHCPFSHFHDANLSHASQSKHESGGFFLDHCFLLCRLGMFENPVEALKSPWIRPEDLHFYEEAGMDGVKLVDRMMPSEDILRAVRAYVQRRWDGDLAEIIHGLRGPAMLAERARDDRPRRLRYLLRPGKVNPLKLRRFQALNECPVIHIDNSKLDGFLKPFVNKSLCRAVECSACAHCERYAKEAVHVDEKERVGAVRMLGDLVKALESGELFEWGMS